MTLARVHTWIAGESLTAAALNAEFNNILANGTQLISPLSANLNFARNQATNLVLENLGSDPVTSSPGRVYFNTGTAQVMVDTGAGIQIVGPNSTARSGVGSRVRGLFGSISTNVATFQAFEFLFQTTNPASGSFLMSGMNNVTFTVNCQTAGVTAGGRDQAAAFAASEVHWYAITTGFASTTPAGIISKKTPFTSDGGPTLPTSYVGWAYLCSAVYTSLSSAPSVPVQRVQGQQTYLLTTSNFAGAGQGNGAGVPILTAATAEVETSVLVNAAVPSIAISYQLQHVGTGGLTSAGGTNLRCQSVIEQDFSVPLQTVDTRIDGVTSGRLNHDNSVVTMPNTNIPASFVYYNVATTGFGSALLNMNVIGYTNINGDQ